MKKKMFIGLGSVIALFIIVIIVTAFISCKSSPVELSPVPAQAPLPAPAPVLTPAPAPVPAPDEPEYSEEEVCSLIWAQIPNQLPDGYNKSKLAMDTRKAIYEGNGKWSFSVSGKVEQKGSPRIAVLKAKGYWVERESCDVTSYDLHLSATYYEKTNTLDIVVVEKQNEQFITEIVDTPILRQEFKVLWRTQTGTPHHGYLEGIVENTGKIPISGLIAEYTFFDKDDNIIAVEECEIIPIYLLQGERGRFMHDFTITGPGLVSYDFRFILRTGEEFTKSFSNLEDEDEEEFFYYEEESSNP